MFCEVCLNEYTLYLDTCPTCDKKIVRKKKISRCWLIDDAIEKLIFNTAYWGLIDGWEYKKLEDDKIIEASKFDIKTIDLARGVENLIDVRDTENIWVPGLVIGVYESKDLETKLLIHYKNWSKKFDELIPVTSHWIAKYGFYTSRTEIPRYDLSSTNINKKPVINLPWVQQIEDIKTKIIEDAKSEFEEDSSNSDPDWEMSEEDLN